MWWYLRFIGSSRMYESVSCIQPMFHLKSKPKPPSDTGFVMPANAVLSSAIIMLPGKYFLTSEFVFCKKSMASRFSFPPNLFGTHSPSRRE